MLLCSVIKEQWIRAKYERKEFIQPVDAPYSKGNMEGYLWKRGKKDGKFYQRKFVLSHAEATIKYYVKEVSYFYFLFQNFNIFFNKRKINLQKQP